MEALGLPISFCTPKQMNNTSSNGRRKGPQAKSVSSNKGSDNREKRVPEALRNFLLEDGLSRVLHDSTNIPVCDKTIEGNIGASYCDVHEDRAMGVLHLDRESVIVSASILGDIDEKHVDDDKTDMIINRRIEDELLHRDSDGITTNEILVHTEFHKRVLDNSVEDSSISSSITDANEVDSDINNVNLCPSLTESSLSFASAVHPYSSTFHEFGDWNVIWDSFYNRNYFYNFKAPESTWYPPPGLEHFAICSDMSRTSELSTNAAKLHIRVEFSSNDIQDIDMHGSHYKTSMCPEKDDLECLNHSSVEAISSRTSVNLTREGSAHSDENVTSINLTTDGSARSEEHGTLKKIADELVSTPVVVDHLGDESNVSAYGEKQEKHIISSEACSEPDASLELCISNSLTATVNGVCNDEGWSKLPDTGMTSSMDKLDIYHGTANKKRKKRVRRLRSQFTLEGVDGDLPAKILVAEIHTFFPI